MEGVLLSKLDDCTALLTGGANASGAGMGADATVSAAGGVEGRCCG